ncbi:unnamed protein product [Linum tenue]|uniref:Transposase n=1 Tax=Linum tenue TaxID=586396 RepID=A0AAV0R2Y9_9ROSI|nr:unnamed protein product [Linum tenue]
MLVSQLCFLLDLVSGALFASYSSLVFASLCSVVTASLSKTLVAGMIRAKNKRAKLRSRPALISTDTEIETMSRVLETEVPSLNAEGDESSTRVSPEPMEEFAAAETVQGTTKGHVGNRGIYKGIDLDKKTKSKKEKLFIYFMPGQKHFRPVGPNERSLNMWLAFCVRSVIGAPIHDYVTILPQYSEQLWSMATDYFQVSPDSPPKLKKIEDLNNTPPPEPLEVKKYKFRTHCFNEMRASYRKYRSRLHEKYKKYKTDEERMKHIPEGLSAEDWQQMLRLFASPEFQIDEETGKLPSASEVWMAQHSSLNANNERKWVDSSSEHYYHEIRRTEEEVMPVDETVNDNEDVLRVVFGARSGYVRGKGTGYKSTAKGVTTNNQNEKIEQLEAKIVHLNAKIADQDKHNLALTQRFEKLLEMVENERHESSSHSGQREDDLTSEETNEEEYTRDECSHQAKRVNKKRAGNKILSAKKKNRS